jgi:hypothetical protein
MVNLWFHSHPPLVRVSGKQNSVLPGMLWLCLAVFSIVGCGQQPESLHLKMSIERYSTLGPIRDSSHPVLSFPVIDVFQPNGEFSYRAQSIHDLEHAFKIGVPVHSATKSFEADTLSDVAERYPDLHLDVKKLHGHPTVILISAPGCHACELQQAQIADASLSNSGINQVFLMLGKY